MTHTNTALEQFLADHPDLVDRQLYQIPLDALRPDPEQPRKHVDEAALESLKESIAKHDVLLPILFRKNEAGLLVIVSGERRYRASQRAGKTTIPGIFQKGENTAELALVENLQREDLSPIEEAEALQKLKDAQGYTTEQLRPIVGKATSTISEILSLNRLPEAIKQACRAEPQYSRRLLVEIAKQETPEAMEAMFGKAQREGLKGEAVRKETRNGLCSGATWKKRVEKLHQDVAALEVEALGEARNKIEEILRELVRLIQEKFSVAE